MNRLNYKFIMNRLKNLKFRNKLLLSYFILIIVPMTTTTIVSYFRISSIIERQTIDYAIQYLDKTKSYLGNVITSTIDVSNIFTRDSRVIEILTKDTVGYDVSYQIEDMKYLETLIRNLQSGKDIYRIRVYVRDNLIYSNEGVNFYNYTDLKKTDLFENIRIPKDRRFIFKAYKQYFSVNDEKRVISLVRNIFNYNGSNDYVPTVTFDILESRINGILMGTKKSGTEYVFILNSQDEMIAGDANDEILQLMKKNGISKIFLENEGESKRKYILINGKRYLTIFTSIPNTEWRLVSVTSMEELLLENRKYRNSTLLFIFIIGITAYFIAFAISHFSVKRINELALKMKKIKENNFQKVKITAKDEVGELQENFNYMIDQIQSLLIEKYQLGKKVKNAELVALQSQIKPHFLYNTLDLINWIALDYNVGEISVLVSKMAKYYKLSLSKGNALTSVADEVMHVKTYVEIENMRFDNSIDLKVEIEELGYTCILPKITLQPIVENSILHGIRERADKRGKITINGKIIDQILVIKVRDNGIGIPKSVIKSILSNDDKNVKNGYGVRNVDERLRSHFGGAYGLSIESKEGFYTEVKITVPCNSEVR